MQIKTTMRYRLTPVKMAVIKETRNNTCWQGCGENGALCSVGGNVNWCSHYGKPYGGSSKNQIELPYGPAISLLGVLCSKERLMCKSRITKSLRAAAVVQEGSPASVGSQLITDFAPLLGISAF
uniref:Uncharacterized protein n=1 Tax=Equus caballus TaxID=9796 RepID=A0A9L0TCE0_HORSE